MTPTPLEHIFVQEPPLENRLPSWIVDGRGENVADAWDDTGEVEVEEVGVGIAITTADEDEEEGYAEREVEEGATRDEGEVGIAVVGGVPGRRRSVVVDGHDADDHDRREQAGAGEVVARVAGGVSSFGEPVAMRSVQGSTGRSHSHSHSGSGSRSNSRSRSSVREVIEMSDSSAATSWTQVEEGTGERPSGDSEGQLSSEVHCRSSTGHPISETGQTIGVGIEAGGRTRREGTWVGTLSHPRSIANADARGGAVDGGRDVSRKEEVLVSQEEDIGEGWRPLRYDGKTPLQDNEKAEGGREEEQDVGSAHAPEGIRGDNHSLEMDEKERWRSFGSSGRNTRHLRLEFKPPSPLPWDEIDPPADNNETYGSDYYSTLNYSTLNSKRFGTMQKSRRRPLIPHSSYYSGPPPPGSAYGTAPVGQIGVHHPREIIRVERDYTGGEVIQFSPAFPLELEGRITPTQFHQTINDINESLISAHSMRHSFVDNFLAVVTLQLSTLVTTSHYTKEMRRLKRRFEEQNTRLYNPVGLNILWPQKVAFQFLEIEYY